MAKTVNVIKMILAIVFIVAATGAIVFMLHRSFVAQSANNATNNNSSDVIPDVSQDKLFDSGKVPWIEEKVTISSDIIRDGLREKSKLVTFEYYFTQVETYEKVTYAWGIPSTANMVYSYDGYVNVGIECSTIEVELNEEDKVIYVTLPRSEIFDVVIDYDSFQQREFKQGFWSKINLSDINKSLQALEANARASALEKGVLSKADKNAEEMMERFIISLLGNNDYNILFFRK